MSEGTLEPLTRAFDARKRGEQPAKADLAACMASRWKPGLDLQCWNGRRPDRPGCGWPGSQNIPVYAHAGLGDWPWIAALCRLEATEGDFGRERGAPTGFYYGGIMDVKCEALKHLTGDDREAVRLAIRSSLAWDAICAVPSPITEDVTIHAGETERSQVTRPSKGKVAAYTPAVSGNRWTERDHGQRGDLLAENSHGGTLSNAVAHPERFGLSLRESEVIVDCIDCIAHAGVEIASWMHGTIDTPDTRWRFRLRRTTLGAESIFFGPFPSPYKPPCAASQVTLDGQRVIVKASPKGVQNHTVEGWEVAIEDGTIVARCSLGESRLPELGGEVLWEVEVEGGEVRFS
jgi:hypothetical protein